MFCFALIIEQVFLFVKRTRSMITTSCPPSQGAEPTLAIGRSATPASPQGWFSLPSWRQMHCRQSYNLPGRQPRSRVDNPRLANFRKAETCATGRQLPIFGLVGNHPDATSAQPSKSSNRLCCRHRHRCLREARLAMNNRPCPSSAVHSPLRTALSFEKRAKCLAAGSRVVCFCRPEGAPPQF